VVVFQQKFAAQPDGRPSAASSGPNGNQKTEQEETKETKNTGLSFVSFVSFCSKFLSEKQDSERLQCGVRPNEEQEH